VCIYYPIHCVLETFVLTIVLRTQPHLCPFPHFLGAGNPWLFDPNTARFMLDAWWSENFNFLSHLSISFLSVGFKQYGARSLVRFPLHLFWPPAKDGYKE
jgi:hypothetical protein